MYMKLTVIPTIVDNRYSVIVKYKGYGSAVLTADTEEKIINDYSPKFKLSDITFAGKYDVLDGEIIKAEIDGEDISLTIPNREIKINDALEIGYTVHINEISDSEIKTKLKDKDMVAQAKCQLFIDSIVNKINVMLTSLGEKVNDFEMEYEVEVG